jgi:hypothetical protein
MLNIWNQSAKAARILQYLQYRVMLTLIFISDILRVLLVVE